MPGLAGRGGLAALACLALAAAVVAEPAEAQSGAAQPTLRVITPRVRAVDGIVVDLEASAIRNSSNLRLAVVPASQPDAVADVQALVADSVALNTTGRLRMTLPGGPPGEDEVRLYHIPRYASVFEVAARAPVTVAPGRAGARLVRDLAREAAEAGPVRFEAAYRDRAILVEAQFLRVRPDSEWDLRWIEGVPRAVGARQLAVISLGTRGLAVGTLPFNAEAVCVLRADEAGALDRIAALRPGDAVAVTARPSTWSSAGAGDPVVLKECRLDG